MATLPGFPLVSQRTTVTSDGRPSEDALYDCVPASIGAVMLWLEGKQQWDATINPDLLKDKAKAYGEGYIGTTSAAEYVQVAHDMGFSLSSIDMPDSASTVATARMLLKQNEPAIFTELDPYVDTSLDAYKDWTHVSVFVGADAGGLTAMDPFIAQLVYKSDVTWASLLRANQVWTVEKLPMNTIPQGWTDDGHTLRSPNGVPIVLGMRDFVLSHSWHKDNWALAPESSMAQLEASNKELGAGSQQVFRWTMLAYTPERGVFVEWIGVELSYLRAQYASLWNAYQKLQAAPAPQPVATPADPRIAQYAAKLAAVTLLLTQAQQAAAL